MSLFRSKMRIFLPLLFKFLKNFMTEVSCTMRPHAGGPVGAASPELRVLPGPGCCWVSGCRLCHQTSSCSSPATAESHRRGGVPTVHQTFHKRLPNQQFSNFQEFSKMLSIADLHASIPKRRAVIFYICNVLNSQHKNRK